MKDKQWVELAAYSCQNEFGLSAERARVVAEGLLGVLKQRPGNETLPHPFKAVRTHMESDEAQVVEGA